MLLYYSIDFSSYLCYYVHNSLRGLPKKQHLPTQEETWPRPIPRAPEAPSPRPPKSTMLLAGQRRTARRATAADRPRSRPHGHPSVSVTAGTRWTKPSRSRPARSTPSSRSRWTSTAHSSPTARQRSSLGRSSRPSRTSSSRPERSGPTPL